MQVLQAAPVRTSPVRIAALPGLVFGLALIASGLALAVVELTSSVLSDLLVRARPGAMGAAVGILGWGIGLILPLALVLIGSIRTARVFRRPRKARLERFLDMVGELPGDHTVALGVALPDGRRVPAVVVTPDGVALFQYLPPPGAMRFRQGQWEARIAGAGWTPIEEPLARTRRDADALRRMLWDSSYDQQLNVYPAVIDEAAQTRRTPYEPRVNGCTLLAPDGVRAFLEALPAGRRLTPGRQEQLVERIRAAIV